MSIDGLPSRAPRDLLRGASLVFAARASILSLLLCLASVTLVLMPIRLRTNWPVGVVEPSVLVGVERVARGEVLYRAYAEAIPLVPLPYGAAEYLVPGWIGRWTQQSEPIALIRIGRVLSLIGLLISAGLCMIAARAFGAPRPWALAAAGGLFAIPAAMEWATKLAPDVPALALSLGGWLLARQLLKPGRKSRRIVSCALSTLCWTAAFHFKPTVIAGPVAYSFELAGLFLSGKRPWMGLSAPAAAILASVSIAAMLDSVSGGLYWTNTAGSMGVCQYSLENLAQTIFLVVPNGIVLTGLLLVLLFKWRSHWLCAAALANFLFELVLATKQGSNVNYFLGTLALSGAALAVSEGNSGARKPSPPRAFCGVRAGLFVGYPVLILGLALQVPGSLEFSRELPMPDSAEIAAVDRAVGEVADRARILCLDPYYGRTRRLEYPFADSYHANLLLSAGVGDISTMVERVRRRDVPLIVANKLVAWKFSPHGAALVYTPLREAILTNYHPVQVGRWLIVFAPDAAP